MLRGTSSFEWQMSWFNWGLSCTDVPYEGYGLVKRYLIIGPLQMRWFQTSNKVSRSRG